MSTPSTPSAAKVDELLQSRGAATPAELGLGTQETLALAKERPDLEPIFLVRFRSRQNKVRVEEVRAYAWPSQQIGMRHLGYRAEEARLLRLEPRQRVPFPARLYATFASDPKQLEELRKTEKAYVKAMKQASSKPGRAERDLLALQTAFKKLGDDVALEMWIEAAATFQRLDNATYASKMLGSLLKLVEKDKKIDASLLARTVLSAADDGVFNAKLYDFTWDLLQKRLSTEAALGLGLRVFRRLMESGRALPTDFTKDLRRAAVNGKVRDFEPLFDQNVVWAAGVASFWNTARRTSSWRDEATKDHAETQLLRARLGELWRQAHGAGAEGEAWKSEVWGRIRAVTPELSTYGRAVLVEHLLAAGGDTRPDGERLLEAALAMLARPARKSDRERVEKAAGAALAQVAAISADILWDKSAALEEALRVATGDLGGFLTLYDLLSDLGESIPARAPASGGEPVSVLRSLPGLLAAWTGAMVAALKPKSVMDDDDDDSDSDEIWKVGPLGEALALMKPEQAPEHLAELGPLVAKQLAADLERDKGLEGWERVLGTLRALGPTGEGVTTTATARFVESAAGEESFGNAARLAHFLDRDALRRAAEARGVVDEALERMLSQVAPTSRAEPLLRPEKELGEAPQRLDAVKLPDGRYSVLWMARPKDRWSNDPIKKVATVLVSPDGKQEIGITGDLKGAAAMAQWVTPQGLRFVVLKDKSALLFDEQLDKPVARLAFGEDGYGDAEIKLGRRCALITFKGNEVLVDTDFKVLGELEHKGWGEWALLEGPEGTPPVAIHHHHGRTINVVYSAPDKVAPAFKLSDCVSLRMALRTDDGAWSIEYENKKGAKRRARLDEAGRWVSSDGAALPERPVVESCDLGRNDWLRIFGELDGYARGDSDGHVTVYDLLDRPVAILKGPKTLVAFDPKSGFGIGPDQVVWDPSLPARMAAAPTLRAAITKQPEDALPRNLYGDPAALATHLEARIAARPAGQDALRQLGDAAAPLLRAAADALMPLLAARDRVLSAVDAPAPVPRTVPPRVPGVSRTAIRRVTRTGFDEPLDGLLFWALDGNDPGPAVEYLLPADAPAHADAWPTAARLVGLAQQPNTDSTLAERALALAEALLRGLEQPDRRFELEAEDALEVDEDDDEVELDEDRAPEIPTVGPLSRAHLLWNPWGRFAKKDPPVALPEDQAKRRQALEGWVRDGLLGPVKPKRVEVLLDRAAAYQFRATVEHAGATFGVDVVIAFQEKGLAWELRSVSGVATGAQWQELFSGLEQGFAAASGAEAGDPRVWPGTSVVRRELLEGLRAGVALTRANLANREWLQLDRWEAPALKGVEDPEHARYVMLAWLLSNVEAEHVGTTRQVFEKVSQAAGKWVNFSSWSSRLDRKQGNKTGDEVQLSPELVALLRTGLLRRSGSRHDRLKLSEDFIVLRDPAEIVAAYARELGLTAKAGGKKA